MEEKQTINGWLAAFTAEESAAPDAVEKYNRIFGDSLGKLCPEDVTERVFAEHLESAELRTSSREELFSSMTLLRMLFGYITRKTGMKLPTLSLPQSFLATAGLSDQKAALLMSEILHLSGRHALCLYLALRTQIPVYSILRLLPQQISLSGETLTVTYDTRTRNPKKTPPKESDLSDIAIRLDPAALRLWEENFLPLQNNAVYLSSGDFEPGERSALQRTLSAVAKKIGFASLPLKTVEEFEWNYEDNAAETFFVDDGTTSRDFESVVKADNALCDLPFPDITALSDMLLKLPVPVQEHCKRTRQIASFVLEFIRAEDWFLDLDLDEYKILTAVYFHDIGKTALNLDDLYPPRNNRESNKLYKSHVDEGLQILALNVNSDLDLYPKETLCGLLRDAISNHHERPDGKGFPHGKKTLSFIGAITSIVDAVDHAVFASGTMDVSISDALDDIAEHAGTLYDASLLAVVAEHRTVFINFLSELRDYYQEKRKWDAYGMRFEFRPFHKRDGTVAAYEAHLFLNDPYYGLLDADGILPLMEEHPQYSVFVRLELNRLCRLIYRANELGVKLPPIFFKIAVREPERARFFEELFRMFVTYNVRYHQIIFAIDESDAIGRGANMPEIAEKFRLIGSEVALTNFGGESSLFPSLDRIAPDYIVMRSEFIDAADSPLRLEFLNNVTRVCEKMDIKVFMPRAVRTATAEQTNMSVISAFGSDNGDSYLNEDNFVEQ